MTTCGYSETSDSKMLLRESQ